MYKLIINYKICIEEKCEKKKFCLKTRGTHFGIAGGGVFRFLAPGFPVLGNRRLAGLACVIHG
jgi:hypothetical protein